MDHGLIMQALQKHTTEKWVLMYIERWLKAPIQHEDGSLEIPTKGSPQGGVISPFLSNLFLHYTFDKWMTLHFREIEFERFADDIIVHCVSESQAKYLLNAISERFKQCGLKLHSAKTKIVYCKMSNRKGNHENVSFDFLGLTFKPKKSKNLKTGHVFTGFGPAKLSQKSTRKIIDTIRDKQLHRKTTTDLPDLALEMAAHLRGWINTYFGKIKLRYLRPVLQYLNDRLVAWARSRYKRLNRSWWQARLWLRTIYHDYPSMFVHWQYGFKPYLFDLSYKSRMTGDCQVRFRESLGVRFPLRYSTM
jgi:RNA-directed DNA polymerase